MSGNEVDNEKVICDRVKTAYKAGQTKEEVRDIYNGLADIYDTYSQPDQYQGPVQTAIECCEVIPEANREGALVLDVAAGTGLLGKELQLRGFRNLHALEPSTKMLEKANTRNIYKKFINEFISEEALVQVAADTYDIVASCGGMGQGHIPAGAVWEMLRITRKGGFIILAMREEYLRHPQYDGILEVLMENMEETGKWKTIKKRIIAKWFMKMDGVVFVFEKA
ncbi:methyltransferase-like protein 27 [Ylistrum balloti]|uniref:methyltransferase-like protein 27 n=1 Tax=Ylistrum balloti TaxID=509963 RepID=UPI0029059AEB|nr:methyltransferase-like protein 27 [Ylistrum balloti]